MVEVYPAILTNDLRVLEQQVRDAETFAPVVHIDITDGRFVPTVSIQAADIRTVRPSIPFEIHLMIDRVDDVLAEYLAIGPLRVILHRGKTGASCCQAVADAGVEPVLAVSPSTLGDDLEPFLASIRQVTFLAVEPGYQGGMLVPGVLQKVRTFCATHPEIPVELDGGIKKTNIPQIANCGAQRFVIGSGIWQTQDPAGAYRYFVEQFQSAFHTPS